MACKRRSSVNSGAWNDLYSCLLSQCEALRLCYLGFPITKVSSLSLDQLGSPHSKITLAMLAPMMTK